MKAMLWKELRENLKWGALALLAMVLAEFYALAMQPRYTAGGYPELTLVSSSYLLVTSFGCTAIGVALALVQILPEQRRDQWAALLHRPVSRATIFFGKVTAGMILYLGATLLATIASICYVITPGQFAAPLVPGMTIPGLSDIVLGAAYYCGTLLICLDRGNWFGRRGAIALSFIPLFIQHITGGMPFLPPLLFCAVYLVAAWDTMLSNGGMQNRMRIGRVAFILAVLMGAETAVLALVFGMNLLPQNKPEIEASYVQFRIAPDGKVFLSTQNGDKTTLTDMDGRVVTDPKYTGRVTGNTFIETLPAAWQLRQPEIDYFGGAMPRNMQTYLTRFEGYEAKEDWFALHRENYFVGYDKLSRRAAAICDSEGFKPPTATPKPFPEKLHPSAISFRSPHLYWAGKQLYSFDFSERNMVTFDTQGEAIYGADSVLGDFHQDKATYVAVALHDDLRLFTPDGKLVSVIPYPHDPDVWTSLSIGCNEKGDRLYLESASAPPWYAYFDARNIKARNLPTYLDEIDPAGHVLRTFSRPKDVEVSQPEGWQDHFSTLVSPFLPAAIGTIYRHYDPTPTALSLGMYGEFQFPQPSWWAVPSELAIILALDLALGITAFFCARRIGFSMPRAVGWLLFVTCFGLPGLITFRFAANWPVNIRCPQCSALRPIDSEKCPNCHQAWSAPKASGIEIFEANQTSA